MSSFQSQNQHMFYSVLGHLAIDIFGESAWALRIPAVLFGVMGLWAVYLLGQRLLGSREALFAFALMTISYHHIWFSQNARGYTGLMFFATLSTWLYLKALKQNRWREWLLYIAAVVLGMWTHLTMAFVIASQVLVWLFLFFKGSDGRPEWRKPLAAFLLSVTLTLQLYALSLPEFFAVALHKGSLKSEWTNPIWMIAESIRGLRIGFLSIPFVLIGGCLLFAGWRNIFEQDRIAAILMVLPAFLGGFTMLVLGHNLWPRFFFFSMGFGVLILVSGAMELPRSVLKKFRKMKFRGKLANRAGIVLISSVILVSLFGVPRCYTLPKQDFTGARDFVEQNIASGDLVVAVGLAGFNYQSYYAPDWCRGNTKESINELLETGKVLWLVYTLLHYRSFHHPQSRIQVRYLLPCEIAGQLSEKPFCRFSGNRHMHIIPGSSTHYHIIMFCQSKHFRDCFCRISPISIDNDNMRGICN